MSTNIIAIGCDHAGFPYKEGIIKYLESRSYEVHDFGTHSADSVDYPDHVHPVASEVETGIASFGVLICGSGNGVCMTANKHLGIRAALVWQSDIAALARQHNNANVICIPARFVTLEDAIAFVDVFLHTQFEGGRHANRVTKMTDF
ncbi:MAG TPA: ribose 5-phosphate isomerase B [Chitinophagales bacterium]|nr:ribose 5-phosphate isomerase B [Chitinophagales bacterium]HMU70029.1 ribose 5-phosphate isomerase B [Chitinophagales bacterium]HMX04600.1 ribose 5-phosphate isomerase B [Chitinophagales bacterium]HMZ88206.1 ribose 5-phosphate isomerase B [Chitinophagales bacterium]HNA58020.1 ribose 5-phosphate isomerase B [Chitinophagales bacterium]